MSFGPGDWVSQNYPAMLNNLYPLPVQNLGQLRALDQTDIRLAYVIGTFGSDAPSPQQGLFVRVDNDTSSADNGGTIIVGSNGHRWYRAFVGAVEVGWFGAIVNDTTKRAVNQAAFEGAAAAHRQIHIPAGAFYLNSAWTINNVDVYGEGCGNLAGDVLVSPGSVTGLSFPAGSGGLNITGTGQPKVSGIAVSSASAGAVGGVGISISANGATVEKCLVQAFGGDGVQIVSPVGTNANNSLVRRVRAVSNFGGGFKVGPGADTNACTLEYCDASDNSGIGFSSNSSNTLFHHPHAANNAGGDFVENGGSNIFMLPYSEGGPFSTFTFAAGTSGSAVYCSPYGAPTTFAGAFLRHMVIRANDFIGADNYGGLRIDHQTGAGEVMCVNANSSLRSYNSLKYDTLKLTMPAAILTGPDVVPAAGELSFGNRTAVTVGAAGGAAALPATPTGYWIANFGGTLVKIPFYNA